MEEHDCVQDDVIYENKQDQAQLEDRSLPATLLSALPIAD